MYNIILLAGFVLALWNILQALRRQGTRAFVLNPVVWFSIFFILIHIAVAALKNTTGGWRYSYDYSNQGLVNAALISVVGYQCAVTFLNMFSARLTARNLDVAGRQYYQFPREHVVWFIFAVGGMCLLIGSYTVFQNYGQLGDAFFADRISAGLGQGLQRSMPNFLISSSILFTYTFLSRVPELQRVRLVSGFLAVISIAIVIFYYNSINSRNSIFLLFILLGSLYLFMRPATDLFSGTFIGKVIFGAVVVVAAWSVFLNMTRTRYSRVESSYTLDRLDRLEYSMIDGAFGNDENIIWMANNNYKRHEGITYFAGFSNFVPRSMWPEKPLGAGPRMKNEIFPGSYIIGAKGNSSFTTGLLAEAWLNFGAMGIFMVLPIWALLLLFFISRVARNAYSIKVLPWMVTVVLWSTLLMYAEFAGFFVRYVFICAPLVVVGLFGSRLIQRQYRAPNKV